MHVLFRWMDRPNFASEAKLLALPDYGSRGRTTDDGDALRVEQSGKVHHGLAAEFAKQPTGNDVPLNFAGAIPDAIYPGVAPHSFKR